MEELTKVTLLSDMELYNKIYDSNGNLQTEIKNNKYKLKIRVGKKEIYFEYNSKDSDTNINCNVVDIYDHETDSEHQELVCYIEGGTFKKPGLIEVAICHCKVNDSFQGSIQETWEPYKSTNILYTEL